MYRLFLKGHWCGVKERKPEGRCSHKRVPVELEGESMPSRTKEQKLLVSKSDVSKSVTLLVC